MKNNKGWLISILVTFFAWNGPGYAATPEQKTVALVENQAAVLNLAGKQRMLTQKISNNVLHISNELQLLEQDVVEFDKIINGLLNGDPELKLVKTENPEIIKQLNQTSELWQSFRNNVNAFLAGDHSPERVEEIAQQNIPVMENMNLAVEMYEKDFLSNLEPGMAKTLNLAGKQRMLSQKMAKEAQLILRGVKTEEHQTHLREDMSLFERTLKGLLEGDEELGLPGTEEKSDIYEQLLIVKKIWEEYKPMLETIIKGDNDKQTEEQTRASIRRTNLQLLMTMHKAVNMYEQSVGLHSSSLRKWWKQ